MNKFTIDLAWFEDLATLESEYNSVVVESYNKIKKINDDMKGYDSLGSQSINEVLAAIDITLQYHEKLNKETKLLLKELGTIKEDMAKVKSSSVYKGLDT